MDISKKYSVDTIIIDELYTPDGNRIEGQDGEPSWIETAAPNSDKYIAAVAKQSRAASAKSKKPRAKNSGFTESEYRETIESGIEFLADLAVNFGGFESDGKPVKFSRDAVIELYTNAEFIRKDVDDAYKDGSLFYKK